MTMVANTTQPFADLIALLGNTTELYDLDTATGAQLDVLGQWVGVSRYLRVAITGVFFSLDVAPGLDQGIVWDSVNVPDQQLTALPDDEFRILLKVRILNNFWDGSLPSLYNILQVFFNPNPQSNATLGGTFILGTSTLGYGQQLYPFVQDNNDLSIYFGFTREAPTPVAQALLTQGELDIKPAGVLIRNYVYPTQNGPIFAFDVDNQYFAGLDYGVWGAFV